MSRSKTATQAYALSVKNARESAVIAAHNAAPIVRDAIKRASVDVLITADRPDADTTNEINARLLSDTETFTRSLPSWLFDVCPEWYIVATPIKDEQTGKVIGHETKRDVEGWDKARIKALESIRSLNFTWRKRADGTDERYIPEPCNMARLLSFVIAGNMQATIDNAPSVVSESRVTKTRSAGFAYNNAGAAQVFDSRAYAIVIAADSLAKRTRAYDKARDEYYTKFGDKLSKAMDRANDALQTAQAQFDRAWADRHLLPKDVLALIAPVSDAAQAIEIIDESASVVTVA